MKQKLAYYLPLILGYLIVHTAIGAYRAHRFDAQLAEMTPGMSASERAVIKEYIDRKDLSVDEVKEQFMRLSKDGVLRLSDADLRLRAKVVANTLAQMSEQACARITRGNASPDELLAFSNAIPSEGDRRGFETLGFRASLGEIQGRPERVHATDADVNDAFQALGGMLGPEATPRLSRVLNSMETASDADLCWAGRTLYSSVERLPEPAASHLARVLADSDE